MLFPNRPDSRSQSLTEILGLALRRAASGEHQRLIRCGVQAIGQSRQRNLKRSPTAAYGCPHRFNFVRWEGRAAL